jgi:hypothetical protein
MTYDEREPRDLPEEDAEATSSEASGPASDPTFADSGDAPTEPIQPIEPTEPAPDAATPVEDAAPAEIESWPSQDASATEASAIEPTSAEPDWRSEPEAAAWPTDPPAAGSGGEDTWPTTAPERGDEPMLEPQAVAAQPVDQEPDAEPPPSEVEAYPAAAAASAAPAAAAAHSVPAAEGEIGESTQCPRCGTENRPGLAFCRNCGQRLVAAGVSTTVERPGTPEGTMACPRCGTHNRAGVAFCQNCGANLRGTAPGYVPPAVAAEDAAVDVESVRRGAVLGPVVLLIGVIGLITGYLLPFLYGNGSLFDRAYGSDGYGIAFWNGYPEVGAELADQAYFGLAGPVPLLVLLLVVLAIAGFVRAAPGALQRVGLVIALLWSVGLIVLFLVVELGGNWGGDLVGVLRALTPAGIIFFLASLIVLIGTLTRFGRA